MPAERLALCVSKLPYPAWTLPPCGAATGDHVDDAADRVRTVERRARTLDDFDALDELRRDVLDGRGPDRPGVDAQAVHQHEYVIRLRAAHEKRCLLSRAAESCDFDARHESQRIAEIRSRLANQLVAADQFDVARTFPAGTSVRVAVTMMGSSAGLPAAAASSIRVFIRAPPER